MSRIFIPFTSAVAFGLMFLAITCTVDHGWSERIEVTPAVNGAYDPAAGYEYGRLHVLWRGGNPYGSIFASFSDDRGMTWVSAVRLSEPSATCFYPVLRNGPLGLYAAWTSWNNGVTQVVFKKTLDHGLTWTAAVTKFDGASGAMVDMYCEASIVAVSWQSPAGPRCAVSWDQGQSWHQPAGPNSACIAPAVTLSSGGMPVMTWTDAAGNMSVSRQVNPDDPWLAPVILPVAGNGRYLDARIVPVAPSGLVIAARYEEDGATGFRIGHAPVDFDETSDWEGLEKQPIAFVHPAMLYEFTCHDDVLRIAATGSDGIPRLVTSFDGGEIWQQAVSLARRDDEDDWGPCGRVSIAWNQASVFAVWSTPVPGTGYSLYLRIYQ